MRGAWVNNGRVRRAHLIVAELKKHYGVANALMYYSYTAGVVALYCIFTSTTIFSIKFNNFIDLVRTAHPTFGVMDYNL
nr:hypothetical protein [Alysiella crassa]UOP06721.1 hypothetical protein LVJ80_13485 [Alysiella crassa]